MQFFKIFWVKLDSLRNSEVNCVPIPSDVLNINRYFQPPQKIECLCKRQMICKIESVAGILSLL